ncbi:MAG: DJ-1/PfpI family protein [bacterium]|nr:DJ-1/PfpI family protein [bacterium]
MRVLIKWTSVFVGLGLLIGCTGQKIEVSKEVPEEEVGIKEELEEEVKEDIVGKRVLMIIASHNFRDEELELPKEVLEKEGVKVEIASSTLRESRGMRGMKVKPDILISDVNVEEFDAVIFIGGIGAKEYWDSEVAHKIAKKAVRSNKVLGAICIAPVTLARAGVLENKKATVWSSEVGRLKEKGAIYTGKGVETDGNIITANGPSAASEFGKAIVKALRR